MKPASTTRSGSNRATMSRDCPVPTVTGLELAHLANEGRDPGPLGPPKTLDVVTVRSHRNHAGAVRRVRARIQQGLKVGAGARNHHHETLAAWVWRGVWRHVGQCNERYWSPIRRAAGGTPGRDGSTRSWPLPASKPTDPEVGNARGPTRRRRTAKRGASGPGRSRHRPAMPSSAKAKPANTPATPPRTIPSSHTTVG